MLVTLLLLVAVEEPKPVEEPPPIVDDRAPVVDDTEPQIIEPPERPSPQAWEPLDDAIADAAEGSLEVCQAVLLPLTIIPTVGEYIGLAAEWACLIPAGFAVEYVALHHGDHAAELWQTYLALVAGRAFATLVSLPVPIVLIAGLVVGGGAAALAAALGGIPITVAITGVVLGAVVLYLVLHEVEKKGEKLVFRTVYGWFDHARTGEAVEESRRNALVGKRLTGAPAVYALMAAAAGADADFEGWFLVPVAGPLWKADAQTRATKRAMRRVGEGALYEKKLDLGAMDGVSDVLAGAEGWMMAGAHVGVIGAAGLVGASYATFYNAQHAPTQQERDQLHGTSELIGTAGLVVGVSAAGLMLLAQTPKVLRPVLVPMAYLSSPGHELEQE